MATKTRNLLVFRYEYWDCLRGERRTSEKYATFDAIVKGSCVPVRESAMCVPRSGAYNHLVELEELETFRGGQDSPGIFFASPKSNPSRASE